MTDDASGLAGMTAQSVGEMIGRPIGDAVVLVAKNMILGGTEESVSQVLGASIEEIRGIIQSEDYRDARMVMAARYNQDQIAADLGYDSIEQIALKKITKALEREKDLDKLVRVAAMANRATRRQKMNQSDTLDAGKVIGRVQLTLTKRLVEKLQAGANGGSQRELTHEVSITSGATSPTFDEIESMFSPVPQQEAEQRKALQRGVGEVMPSEDALLAMIQGKDVNDG